MIDEIDGAKVIQYTNEGDFGFIVYEDENKGTITTLAICNYNNKEEYYLFACGDSFEVLGDTVHSTVEEARLFAKEYYEIEEITWINRM